MEGSLLWEFLGKIAKLSGTRHDPDRQTPTSGGHRDAGKLFPITTSFG